MTFLRLKNIFETARKIYYSEKGKRFIAFEYPANDVVESALLEYKNDEELQRFLGEFKEVNRIISATMTDYLNKRMED